MLICCFNVLPNSLKASFKKLMILRMPNGKSAQNYMPHGRIGGCAFMGPCSLHFLSVSTIFSLSDILNHSDGLENGDHGGDGKFLRQTIVLWDKTRSFWDIESSTFPRAREWAKWASEETSEHSGARKRSKQGRASERVSSATKRVNRWASGPVSLD